jgi:hypothetical protein
MGQDGKLRAPARLAGGRAGSERRPGWRAIGTAVARLAGPIVARRGGGVLTRLKADWPAVVGAELATQTWPAALGRDGALKLRVAGAVALELQHRAPLVVARINTYLGRDAVTRLLLVQGPLPLAVPPAKPVAAAPLAEDDMQAIADRLAGVADPDLRAALARLGQGIAAASRRR